MALVCPARRREEPPSEYYDSIAVRGCGGFTPLASRNECRFRSMRENCHLSLANNTYPQQASTLDTYHALLPQRHHAVPDPEAPATHHVGQHHVSCEPVAHDGHLRGVRHARLRVLPKVGHDVRPAPGLLGCVRQHVHPRALLDGRGLREVLVPRRGARCVGDDEELPPGVRLAQLLKVLLDTTCQQALEKKRW